MGIISRHKSFLFAVALSFLTYLFFYGQFLTPSHFFWSTGQETDAQIRHLPARTYLYDRITKEHSFPFWTEKMYSGFPIYADMENAYLNPLNVSSVLLFGPRVSYKVLHLLEYLVGSLSLYFLLRRKGVGFLGYAVANIIFYFNTFFINHQIHYGMVMALYLLPTSLLSADLFLEKRQWRYVIMESLIIANAVLWGHIQSVAILLMGIFAYMAVFSFKKTRFLTFIFFFVALGFFVTIETLPQMLPTYELFSQSSREGGTDYLKGSLNPRMAIFSFVPYLLGESNNFIGREISADFRYNEIYFYCGISALILSFLALLALKKSREVIVAFVFIWIFLLFGFMESNHIFPSSTPLITYFREWERTVILFVFGVAFLSGMFIERIKEVSFKNIKTGFLFVAAPLAYILMLISLDKGKIARKLNFYASCHYIQTYPHFHMLCVIALSSVCILLILFIVKKTSPHIFSKILLPIKLLIVAVIFFDLLYFSKDVLSLRLQDISDYEAASIPKELENKRVILSNLDILGMESLYYANWSPFGTSQLKESAYTDYYGKLGYNLRGATTSLVGVPNDLRSLRNAGIAAVSQHSGITFLNNNKLDLIKNNLDGYYVEKKEGHVVMRINNPSDSIINTYLKYSPCWKVKIDGQKAKIMKNGVFFDFSLKQGDHLVEIYYYPRPFFWGIFFSLVLFAVIITAYFLSRKLLYARILKI